MTVSALRPAPPLAVNSPICRLPGAERLVVWTMRAWVLAMRRQEDPRAAILSGLLPYDLIDAANPFNGLMCLIGWRARFGIDVRCPSCPHLGDGEQRMIGFLAAAQGGADNTVAGVAAETFQSDAVPGAVWLGRQVAGKFMTKGLILPMRPSIGQAAMISSEIASVSSCSAGHTVH